MFGRKDAQPKSSGNRGQDRTSGRASEITREGDQVVEAAIKENVHQSVKDVLANSAILSEAVHSGNLQVVEAEYTFDSGKVVRLDSSSSAQN